MLSAILAIIFACGALAALMGAAVVAGLLYRLWRSGPDSASAALERGDTLLNCWKARQPNGRAHFGLGERCAIAGRKDELGVAAVEERASYSSYAR